MYATTELHRSRAAHIWCAGVMRSLSPCPYLGARSVTKKPRSEDTWLIPENHARPSGIHLVRQEMADRVSLLATQVEDTTSEKEILHVLKLILRLILWFAGGGALTSVADLIWID